MMKLFRTMLAAGMIAGSCTLAMAQAGGGGGAGGDLNPHRVGRGTDANPSAINANPKLGNSAARPSQRNLSRNDNARWDGRYRAKPQYSQNNRQGWDGGYGYGNGWNNGWRNNGWNNGYNGGWSNAPVGLSFGSRPAWGGSNECYEDLGYGRYESCDW